MRSKMALHSASMSFVSFSTNQEPPSGSTVLAAPLSCWMTCWVRTARRTALSEGRARASSIESVWSDCVPPITAASAWMATRTRLTSGCCSVRETPAVWVWKRMSQERDFFAPKRSRIWRAQMRRAARNFAISSKKSL